MNCHRIWLSLVLAAAAAGAANTPPVRVELEGQKQLVVSRLPPILEDAELVRHLTTGLTTTFMLQVELGRHAAAGGARIGVRYELWDEVFDVVVLSGDGAFAHLEMDDLDALEQWWTSLSLVVLELGEQLETTPERATVTLDVVPFSQSEREDTRQWFATTVSGVAKGEEESAAQSAEVRRDAVEQIFGVLMATSIRSRSVFSYRWTVDVTRGEKQ